LYPIIEKTFNYSPVLKRTGYSKDHKQTSWRVGLTSRLRRLIVFKPPFEGLTVKPPAMPEVLDATLFKEDFIMASDTFLEISGIKGESTDKDHKEWIEILSYNWGVSQMASSTASSAGGGSTQRADFQDLSVVKELDSSTPLLSKACWGGQHIDKVKLQLNRAAGDKREPYMEYEMENVIISSVSVGGGGGGVPTESLTFNYGKLKTTYYKTARKGGGAAGAIPAGWNLEENVHI